MRDTYLQLGIPELPLQAFTHIGDKKIKPEGVSLNQKAVTTSQLAPQVADTGAFISIRPFGETTVQSTGETGVDGEAFFDPGKMTLKIGSIGKSNTQSLLNQLAEQNQKLAELEEKASQLPDLSTPSDPGPPSVKNAAAARAGKTSLRIKDDLSPQAGLRIGSGLSSQSALVGLGI